MTLIHALSHDPPFAFARACASAVGGARPRSIGCSPLPLQAEGDDDDAFFLFLQKQKINSKLSTSYSSPLPCAHPSPKFPRKGTSSHISLICAPRSTYIADLCSREHKYHCASGSTSTAGLCSREHKYWWIVLPGVQMLLICSREHKYHCC